MSNTQIVDQHLVDAQNNLREEENRLRTQNGQEPLPMHTVNEALSDGSVPSVPPPGPSSDGGDGADNEPVDLINLPDVLPLALPATRPALQYGVPLLDTDFSADAYNDLTRAMLTIWILQFPGGQRNLTPDEIDPVTGFPLEIPANSQVVSAPILAGFAGQRFSQFYHDKGPYRIVHDGQMALGMQAGIALTPLPDDADGNTVLEYNYPADHEDFPRFIITSIGDANGNNKPTFIRIHEASTALEANHGWHQRLIEPMSGGHILRMLDAAKLNEDFTIHPDETNTVDDNFWGDAEPLFNTNGDIVSRRGVPFRALFDLCHEAGSRPWMHIPMFWGATAHLEYHPAISTPELRAYGDSQVGALMTGNGPQLFSQYFWDEYEASALGQAGTVDAIYIELMNEIWNFFANFRVGTFMAERIGRVVDPAIPENDILQQARHGAGWLFARHLVELHAERERRGIDVELIHVFAGQAAQAITTRYMLEGVQRFASDNGIDEQFFFGTGKVAAAGYAAGALADRLFTGAPTFHAPVLQRLGFGPEDWAGVEAAIVAGTLSQGAFAQAMLDTYSAFNDFASFGIQDIPNVVSWFRQHRDLAAQFNLGGAITTGYAGPNPLMYEAGSHEDERTWVDVNDAKYALWARFYNGQGYANLNRMQIEAFRNEFGEEFPYSIFVAYHPADVGDGSNGGRPGRFPWNIGKFEAEADRPSVQQLLEITDSANYS